MNINLLAMDSKTWLDQATAKLSSEGISSARLDALILLEDELGFDRALILAEPIPINSSKLATLNKKLERRAMHEPLSFIREKTEFYGREFYINKDVLEPRPESETMIELLVNTIYESEQFDSRSIRRYAEDSDREINSQTQTTIIDVGTGSGALAITAKLELPYTKVIAIDIDEKCLVVAKKNAKKLLTDIEFYQGNLLAPISHLPFPISHILANLPYVPDKYKLNPSARFEPRLAIFGGKDGLDIYRQLFEQINKLPVKPSHIYTELLPFQHEYLNTIAQSAGYKQTSSQDLIQVFSLLSR